MFPKRSRDYVHVSLCRRLHYRDTCTRRDKPTYPPTQRACKLLHRVFAVLIADIELQDMKFGSTLQFNAVPEWRDHYLDYDQLKKLIFRLERANVRPSESDTESMMDHGPSAVFLKALDKEISKVDSFYEEIEGKIFMEVDELEIKLRNYFGSPEYRDTPEISSAAASLRPSLLATASEAPSNLDASAIVDDDHDNEAAVNGAPANDGGASDSSDDEATPAIRRRSTIHEELVQKKSIPFENVSLRREIKRLYVLLNELLSFSDLNREGVRKALKKFDKVHGTSLLSEQIPSLGRKRVFSDSANHDIGALLDKLVSSFGKLVGEPNEKASETLASLLREHVVYERNTVWRELIGLERQAQGVQSGTSSQPSQAAKRKRRGWARVMEPQSLKLIGIFIVFGIFLLIQPMESVVQSRCLSVVILGSLLWATETLPLFVTSLLIPVLVVVLRIPMRDGRQLSAPEASAFVFGKMWSPVITVLLGGFTLAAALSKYNMAKALAQTILTRVGTNNPRKIILVLMFVAAFLCMWISNVAAPVLLFSVAQPLLRTIPPGDPFGKALIMGIALASNVGGMTSPIASPQNILALENMSPEPSWMEWFWVSLPVSAVSIVLIWMWLSVTFPITSAARESLAHIRAPGVSQTSHFGFVHAYILTVTVVTIGLWCFSHQLEPLVGDMGVLALVPMVLLFGPGILNAADFNNFLWTIVALAMGGIVLGQSVESCGLLATVATYIQTKVSGLPVFAICVVFGLMVIVLASFISHTVAALIILPLVKSVGEQLDNPHPRLIVMISALLCSGAMALPTSGFPNVTAVCMVDELGTPYLTVADFISRGVPASLIVYAVVVTLGYLLCTMVSF